MRRVLTAVACVLLLALCIYLMDLHSRPPVEAPEPAATQTPTPTPTPIPTQTPGVLVIHPPEGWDGDWEDLYVAIPVDGMEENPDEN